MEGRQLKRCQDGFEEVGVNTDRGSPILPAKHHPTRPKLHKEAFQLSSALPSLEVNLYSRSLHHPPDTALTARASSVDLQMD